MTATGESVHIAVCPLSGGPAGGKGGLGMGGARWMAFAPTTPKRPSSFFWAVSDGGVVLDETVARRMLTLAGAVHPITRDVERARLTTLTEAQQNLIQRHVSERDAGFLEAEADKLEGWADDLKLGKEPEIKEVDRQIRESKRASVVAAALEEKLVLHREIKSLELQRNQERRALFDAQDEGDHRREELIAMLEAKLEQETALVELSCVRWVLE